MFSDIGKLQEIALSLLPALQQRQPLKSTCDPFTIEMPPATQRGLIRIYALWSRSALNSKPPFSCICTPHYYYDRNLLIGHIFGLL